MKNKGILIGALIVLSFGFVHQWSPQESLEILAEGDLLGIAEDKHPEKQHIHKFGANLSVGTTLEPVTTSGTYQTPTSLTSLELVSTSTQDVAAGTGARKVRVEGIGADWLVVTEDVVPNGTTPVALSNQFYRIYRVKVIESGTYASTSGSSHNSTITVRGAGAGATWADVISDSGFGLGQSQIGSYTCPAGKKMYIMNTVVDVESAKTMDLYMFVREGADTVAAPYDTMRVQNVERTTAGELQHPIKIPRGPYICPADIGHMGKVASGTASAEVYFEILLVDE